MEEHVTLFDDPAEAAAPIAHRLARTHCRIDPASGESCAWYHGARLYIRALGIGQCSIPETHRVFFERAFGDLAREASAPSILVSGSADYAMPALILNAFPRAQLPRLTVIDICATPLRLIEWYAERHGISIAVRHSDILACAEDAPGDVLCTHHLFNYFAPAARAALAAKWHGMLRPGGTLIVVNRFRTPGTAPRGASDARRAQFTAAAIAAARPRGQALHLPGDAFAAMIRDYRARIRAYCLDSEDELRQLLERAGFAVETYVNLAQSRVAAGGEESADAVGAIARRL